MLVVSCMRVLVTDKEKAREIIQRKRESLVELRAKMDVYMKHKDPVIQGVGTAMWRTCSELIHLWEAVEILAGSIYELRDVVVRKLRKE